VRDVIEKAGTVGSVVVAAEEGLLGQQCFEMVLEKLWGSEAGISQAKCGAGR
jgi:hypothetical protein